MKLAILALLATSVVARETMPVRSQYGVYCNSVGGSVSSKLASGPYRYDYYEQPSLPQLTISAALNAPTGLKLSVFVWGNGVW